MTSAAIKELEREIENRRTKKGAASDQLRELAALAPVGRSRDELKDLRAELREIIERQDREIQERRKELREQREQHQPTDGPAATFAWAEKQLGVVESPSGSNWGHPVQDWIQWIGYTSPVPWCGVFAGYAAAKIGGADIPSPIRIGYAPFIGEDARAGRNGLKAVPVSEARPGDIFQYGAVHVGLCGGPTRNGQVEALEGNTSPGLEGSQFNGGCVAHKMRPVSFVTTCARPDY